MRRWSQISGMTIVTCDYSEPVRFAGEPEVCGEEFRTCSSRSIVTAQLAAHDWAEREILTDDGKIKQDLCPYHAKKVKSRMTMADSARGDSSGSRFG